MSDPSRRTLLGVSAGLAGLLATFTPGAGQAAAEPDPASKAFSDLLEEAMRTGDLETALRTHGEAARLNPAQRRALRELTPEELTVLRRIRAKLMRVTDGTSLAFVTAW